MCARACLWGVNVDRGAWRARRPLAHARNAGCPLERGPADVARAVSVLHGPSDPRLSSVRRGYQGKPNQSWAL